MSKVGGAASQVFTVEADSANEALLIAAAVADEEVRGRLTKIITSDAFLVEEHRVIWWGLCEMGRRGLAFDPGTLRRLVGDRVRPEYLVQLSGLRTDGSQNVDWHLGQLLWDRQRATAAMGPVSSLLAALRNPAEPPEKVRALARHVATAFEGGAGAGRWLHDAKGLVAEQLAEIRARVDGRAIYPFGIEGLDKYEFGATDPQTGKDLSKTYRMIPGAAPGMITLLAGSSGAGKSTTAAHLALGLARQGRKGLYCAWEPRGGMTLELLACLSLGWSRTALLQGKDQNDLQAPMPLEQIRLLGDRMDAIGQWVTFMRNPFWRQRSEKPSNRANLDLLQEHVTQAGVEWVICDLWERLLVEDAPSDEKKALFAQQAMAEDTGVHFILLAQQRKDIEQRQDKRPTREGVAGSGAWIQVADNVLAPYRPAQWMQMPDDKLEIHVLKQRWGKWPLAVEFDWDGDKGAITKGRSVDYKQSGESGFGEAGGFIAPKGGNRGPRQRGR